VAEAAALLRAARPHAARLGIAFHVGSQCLDPAVYAAALRLAADSVVRSEAAVDIVDVGGGFPVSYPDTVPPPLDAYIAAIAEGAPLHAFELFGPTCDSADRMKGPFLLPEDIDEGDWIELGQLGAYGACLRTKFNGFDGGTTVEVSDPPLLATPGYEE